MTKKKYMITSIDFFKKHWTKPNIHSWLQIKKTLSKLRIETKIRSFDLISIT